MSRNVHVERFSQRKHQQKPYSDPSTAWHSPPRHLFPSQPAHPLSDARVPTQNEERQRKNDPRSFEGEPPLLPVGFWERNYSTFEQFAAICGGRNMQDFMKEDGYVDKYLLAMSFVYLIRAGLRNLTDYDVLMALYLANDMEEDCFDTRDKILEWLYGSAPDVPEKKGQGLSAEAHKYLADKIGFMDAKDRLLTTIGYRCAVSRNTCDLARYRPHPHRQPSPVMIPVMTSMAISPSLGSNDQAVPAEDGESCSPKFYPNESVKNGPYVLTKGFDRLCTSPMGQTKPIIHGVGKATSDRPAA